MRRQRWYLLAYDIRQPKRLKRLHYHLKKHALALQKSVFLVEERNYQAVVNVVQTYSKQREDDVRLYPIVHPNALWSAGLQADALLGLGIEETHPNAIYPIKEKKEGVLKRTMKWLIKN